jgi:small subunit ribosomal protein S17e
MYMGNIRTKDIKHASFDLVESYPEKFTTDFEHNKVAVNEFKLAVTKLLRNKIAGYITRVVRVRQH